MKYSLLILLLFSGSPVAKKIKNNFYGDLVVDKINSVYDGDTFRVTINHLHPLLGQNIAIRVNGIDTPEIRGKCLYEKTLALKAKKFTTSFLSKSKKVELKNIKRGKYFRIVADVFSNNISLGEILIKSGFAVKYNGKHKKKNWCSEII